MADVVIVGAGFGGLNAARALGNRTVHGEPVQVTVVDRNNYHGFWPLLYQVATAGLEPESVAYPVRAILRPYRNVRFLMAPVTGVDLVARQVITPRRRLDYHHLVLAAGSANNYFGHHEMAEWTFGLKDVDDATALRNHILDCFEEASGETAAARRRVLLTFVIVGGGPTGVELAGALAELFRHVMRHDFPDLPRQEARVLLIEGTQQVLQNFPASLRRHAEERLQRMGVEVRLGEVVQVHGTGVTFKNGEEITAATVIWAAGVKAASLSLALPLQADKGGRLRVLPTLQLPDHPEVWVIGDLAHCEAAGQPLPMLAAVAVQQGRQAGRNILAVLAGQPPQSFSYFNKGQMATIGRNDAVFDSHGIHLGGFVAWAGWLVVHLMRLIGFRNRLVVLFNWAYNYFTYDRGVRIISGARSRAADEARNRGGRY